jgi:hypothetical protein
VGVATGVDSGVPTGSGTGSAGPEDASSDVVSTLDARPPTNVDRSDCPDADALLVYTITDDFTLQSFNPATAQFKDIGHISCPISDDFGGLNTPFSMAVDRKGVAYVLFHDRHLYRVSTATAGCLGTAYVPGQSSFQLFGMGFTTNANGPTETLFVAGDDIETGLGNDVKGARGIARIDPSNFALSVVTDFPTVNEAELTGTGDGRLYAFYRKNPDPDGPPPSFIGQLDTKSGQVVGERRFDTVGQGSAWAFAFWGGDFYMFHAPGFNGTTVTRWRPSDDSVADIATNPSQVVGAGVSTCAPQQ